MEFECLICGQISSLKEVDEATKNWYLEGCTTLSKAIEKDEVKEYAYKCPCCNSEVMDNDFKLKGEE